MQPQSLLVVDIETVPDKSLHEGEKFPILPFHQVVAIAFLKAEIGRLENGDAAPKRSPAAARSPAGKS